MKGISHFVTGVALATFFSEVVRQAELGGLLPMLGGIGGLLPDTIDFKIARYWEKFDVSIDPGLEPDADAIADALVEAMQKAYQEGVDQNVIAHTIRLGVDLWREYSICFYPEKGEIAVKVGPLVNTGQVPYAGTSPDGVQEARRQVGMPMVHTYSEQYKVNIFTGPTFRFAREDDKLVVHFLDWHHRWTHSLLLAMLVGMTMGAFVGAITGDWNLARWGGLVTWLGFSGHILEDQLGHMGSNLFWPLTKKRIPGLGLIHAGDALPNFLTVWTSLSLILFNLDRFAATARLPKVGYLLTVIGMPWVLGVGIVLLSKFRKDQTHSNPEDLRQAERIDEATPVELT